MRRKRAYNATRKTERHKPIVMEVSARPFGYSNSFSLFSGFSSVHCVGWSIASDVLVVGSSVEGMEENSMDFGHDISKGEQRL